MKDSILHPAHPERICWGCDRYCAADDLACGNGTVRTQHPAELLGDDWLMLIPSSAVESMGMGGMLGAAAMRQQELTEPGQESWSSTDFTDSTD